MKLADGPKRIPLLITAVTAEKRIERRLKELGIFVGAHVFLVAFSPLKSSVLLEVGDVRVAVSRSVANKIEVVERGR